MSAILQPSRGSKLFVELATSSEDITSAQQLRYRVFAEEMGASLATAARTKAIKLGWSPVIDQLKHIFRQTLIETQVDTDSEPAAATPE